jgi:hypothetical protein
MAKPRKVIYGIRRQKLEALQKLMERINTNGENKPLYRMFPNAQYVGYWLAIDSRITSLLAQMTADPSST